MVRFEVSFEDQGAVVTIDGTAVVVGGLGPVVGDAGAVGVDEPVHLATRTSATDARV